MFNGGKNNTLYIKVVTIAHIHGKINKDLPKHGAHEQYS